MPGKMLAQCPARMEVFAAKPEGRRIPCRYRAVSRSRRNQSADGGRGIAPFADRSGVGVPRRGTPLLQFLLFRALHPDSIIYPPGARGKRGCYNARAEAS